MSSITSFNTAQASSTTPSKIVDSNTFYGTIQPLNLPVGLIAFPLVSSAEYPHIEISLKNSRNIKIQLQQSSTDEVDGNGDLVTLKTETIESNIAGTGVVPLSTTSLPLLVYYDVTYPFVRVVLTNEDAVNSNEVFLTTRLVATRPSNANIHYDNIISGGIGTDDNGVTRYNSNGRPKVNFLTINDNTDRLRVDAEVTIDDLEPFDDGVAVYGSNDGVDRIILKTDANGKVIVEDMDKLEINANKVPETLTLVSTNPLSVVAGGQVTNYIIDLGTDELRMRNIAYLGEVDVITNTDPKIIMSFSENNQQFYSDGTNASFYKRSATTWEFCFQRSNIGLRYVKLVAQNATTFNKLKATQFKN